MDRERPSGARRMGLAFDLGGEEGPFHVYAHRPPSALPIVAPAVAEGALAGAAAAL